MSDETSTDRDLYEPFVLLAELCTARGETGLSKTTAPGQTHVIPINATWRAWLNPHNGPANTDNGVEVPRLTAYVEYNGWPWGLIDPRGGTVGDHPLPGAGNLNTFMAAVRAAIEESRA